MDEKVNPDWQKVRQIFEDVLHYPAAERRQRAEKLCGRDESLWNEVESLLDWQERSQSFLETSAVIQVQKENKLLNQLVPGQRLLHYEIRELIGMGGMGEVYLARDMRLHRNVAIKLLRKDLLPHIRTDERLLREARTAALLEHPNICQIHEISEVDEFSFIVMQYVQGTTLDEILSSGPISSNTALDIASQVAEALAEAHRQGIIHRDIKPANVIVSDNGHVKILDFGLAKFIEAETGPDAVARMESTGGIMGTVPYMSPEQLLAAPVDAKTDVFSFGAMFFEMLSGSPAFGRQNNAETISAILHEELDWSLVSPRFQQLVQRCLAKDPSNRYVSAGQLVEALAEVRKQNSTAGRVQSNRPVNTGSISSVTERMEMETAPIIAIPSANASDSTYDVKNTEDELHRPAPARRTVLLYVLSAIVLSAVIFVYFYSNGISQRPDRQNETSEGSVQRLYWELTDADKREFIERRVAHIQTLINDDQRTIDRESLEGIAHEVDWYASRRDSLSQEPYKEGLRSIYGRATQYVSLVSYEFEKTKVPPVIGIYQAMVESEYRDCLVSNMGPVGFFQFTRRTAALYGMSEKDLCKVDKQSNAAARYMSDLLTEFDSGNSSWTLSLLGFQQGAEGTREQLNKLNNAGIYERNYWAIAEHRGLFDDYLESSDIYIRRFFAAAIVGETPESFGLVTPPLSTIRSPISPGGSSVNDLMAIPGGTFTMGRNVGNENEMPAHEETVKPFKTDRTEVTNAEFYDFVKATDYKPASAALFLAHWKNGKPIKGEEKMPVRYVNIDDINAYARWRWDRDGVVCRLPTEQEWEFAARNGNTGNLFPWGDAFDSNCAFVDQNNDNPTPVGAKSCPNIWGVMDLVGNVAEWTSTPAWLYPNSKGGVILPTDQPRYMVRGGGARSKSREKSAATSTWRADVPATTRSAGLGFRLVTDQTSPTRPQ